jgi:hypothetical protein
MHGSRSMPQSVLELSSIMPPFFGIIQHMKNFISIHSIYPNMNVIQKSMLPKAQGNIAQGKKIFAQSYLNSHSILSMPTYDFNILFKCKSCNFKTIFC